MTNTETGFFQPIPLADGSLLVFRYTGDGFVPSRIATREPARGRQRHLVPRRTRSSRSDPVLKAWMRRLAVGGAAGVARRKHRRRIDRSGACGWSLVYPSFEGYKDTVAVGVRVRTSPIPLQLNRLSLNAGVSPIGDLQDSERVHLRGEYQPLRLDRARGSGTTPISTICSDRPRPAARVRPVARPRRTC